MTEAPPAFSHLSLAYLEGLYADYLRDPASVPLVWQSYFAGLTNGEPPGKPPVSGPVFRPYSVFNPPTAAVQTKCRERNRMLRVYKSV